MKHHGLFRDVHNEVGHIIVAEDDEARTLELVAPDHEALKKLIDKTEPAPAA
ncbi:MAG: hypothetical protein H6682_16865 [Candidatus Eisenbacteria bacterium]|nr:hypothetical protein [Candidatus Eisenbacteria bacterium]